MDIYKISATGVSINYLPEYIADELGFFEEVGIKVETDVPLYWPQVLKDLDNGTHHAACGGIWVPSMYKQKNIKEYKAFAKISSRCPYMLVAREEIKDFNWKMLEDKKVIVAGNGGASAYIFLSGTAKEAGADINKVDFVHDFLESMIVDLFGDGNWGDFAFVTPVAANKLVSEGKGYIVAEMTKDAHPLPWSVYYSNPDVLDRDDNLNGRFALALQRGFDWLHSHTGEDCKEILIKKWPDMDVEQGIKTVDNFLREGMWSKSIKIDLDENDRYSIYQVDAGILEEPLKYEDIVDTRASEYMENNIK